MTNASQSAVSPLDKNSFSRTDRSDFDHSRYNFEISWGIETKKFAFAKLHNLEFKILKPLILGRIFIERPR